MPLIKRYPNRKLYDTEARRYITLKALAGLVRSGEEIRVVDHASGEDLTALTLSQIIAELEKKRSGFLPGHLLAGIIQAGGDTIGALQYNIAHTLGFSQQVDAEIERRMGTLVEEGDLTPEDGQRLLEKLAAAGSTPTSSQKIVERILARRNLPSRTELEHLGDQIESLAARLEKLENKESE